MARSQTDISPSKLDASGIDGFGSGLSTSERTDEEIVAAYLESRCPSDFEQLVRRYEREMYTFLRRYLGDAQQAEDVFQATFLSVHLRIEQFDPKRRFRPWLYAIASNKAIDSVRRNRRHQCVSLDAKSPRSESDDSMIHHLPGLVDTPVETAMANETGDRIRAAVRELSEPTQQLIQLAFYQGMKYSDIGDILQIPTGTVKSRVFTAIRKLNQIWMRMNEGSQNRDSQ